MGILEDIFAAFGGGSKPSPTPSSTRAPLLPAGQRFTGGIPSSAPTLIATRGGGAKGSATSAPRQNTVNDVIRPQASQSQKAFDPWANIGRALSDFSHGLEKSPLVKGNDTVPSISGRGVPELSQGINDIGQAQYVEKKASDDAQLERDRYAGSLGPAGRRQVRQLTDQEWTALTPNQQRDVINSYALYQASEADRKAGSHDTGKIDYQDKVSGIFGEQGGSDTYAPKTVALLNELGYKNDKGDLDQFLNGSAIPTYENITGEEQNDARSAILQSLGDSDVYNNESLKSSLNGGASLINSLQRTSATPKDLLALGGIQSPSDNLSTADQDELDILVKNLGSRNVYSQAQSDPSLNQQLQAGIDEMVTKHGSDVVARYLRNRAQQFGDPVNFMSPDEFTKTWLGE
jgi:hypothetical protein